MRNRVYQGPALTPAEEVQRANQQMLGKAWQATILNQSGIRERDEQSVMDVTIATPPRKGPHAAMASFNFLQNDVVVRVTSIKPAQISPQVL